MVATILGYLLLLAWIGLPVLLLAALALDVVGRHRERLQTGDARSVE